MQRASLFAEASPGAAVQYRLYFCNNGERDLFRSVRADIEPHRAVKIAVEFVLQNASVSKQLLRAQARPQYSQIQQRL